MHFEKEVTKKMLFSKSNWTSLDNIYACTHKHSTYIYLYSIYMRAKALDEYMENDTVKL